MDGGITLTEMHQAMLNYVHCIGGLDAIDDAHLAYSESDAWFSYVFRSAAGLAEETVSGNAGLQCECEYISELQYAWAAQQPAMTAEEVPKFQGRVRQCLDSDDHVGAYRESPEAFVECYERALREW